MGEVIRIVRDVRRCPRCETAWPKCSERPDLFVYRDLSGFVVEAYRCFSCAAVEIRALSFGKHERIDLPELVLQLHADVVEAGSA